MANSSKTFSFAQIPNTVNDVMTLSNSSLTDEFEVAALSVLALCYYESDVNATVEMINYLKGPQPLSPFDLQFIKDRLVGKYYVPRSFLKGTSPANNYQPSVPYEITVSDNPYSYNEDGYVTLYLQSTGADSPRPIKLRKKGNQWFLWSITFLADIRKPAEEDPWA